jgi:uncharacterized protein
MFLLYFKSCVELLGWLNKSKNFLCHDEIKVLLEDGMDRITVENRSIIIGLVGSHGYGLSRPSSDKDYRGIFIAPKVYYLGSATIEQKDSGWSEPGILDFLDDNQDTAIYELRKYVQLAANSNPNILELLWLKEYLLITPVGKKLLANRQLFLSKKAKHTFSGYAAAQIRKIESHRKWLLNPPEKSPNPADFGLGAERPLTKDELHSFLEYLYLLIREKIEYFAEAEDLYQLLTGDVDFKGLLKQYPLADEALPYSQKLTNSRSDFIKLLQKSQGYRNACREWDAYQSWLKNRNPQRAGMEKQSGFDLKHAMHCLRILRSGTEVLRSGEVPVDRVAAGDADELRGILNGDFSYEQVKALADAALMEMEAVYRVSSLPERPNLEAIDQLCVELVEEFGW